MKLAVFNGSPRGKNSNSKVLIEQFLNGYQAGGVQEVSVCDLVKRTGMAENLESAGRAEYIIIIFPLYTDCMPGIVMEFFEALAAVGALENQKLGFIVHSGFPESSQSDHLERYLAKFAKRTGFEYLGTIIKGGSEGIRMMPEQMTRKLFGRLYELGLHFSKTGEFSEEITERLRNPRQMSRFIRLLFPLLSKIGLTNIYWNSNLKKYKAYGGRFAKPFINREIY